LTFYHSYVIIGIEVINSLETIVQQSHAALVITTLCMIATSTPLKSHAFGPNSQEFSVYNTNCNQTINSPSNSTNFRKSFLQLIVKCNAKNEITSIETSSIVNEKYRIYAATEGGKVITQNKKPESKVKLTINNQTEVNVTITKS
jgi:hypothetical protein